jgi:hypothetical protein
MDMHSRDEFSESFEYASGATGKRFQNPLWQITEIFFGSEFRNAIQVVKAFGLDIVATAIESQKSEAAHGPGNSEDEDLLHNTSGTLVNSLLDSIKDPKIVADSALNYLSAGAYQQSQPCL